MPPPHPQLSLPTPQKLTFQGASRPFCLRKADNGLCPSKLRYSTHLFISSTVPLPTLAVIYGSQPSRPQSSRNSWVPKLLSSFTFPQLVLIIEGRCARGPMPSRQ